MSRCKWYVNACNYFGDLAEEIPKAKKDVFIAGWWVTPGVYLRRMHSPLQSKDRLDNILLERAKAGVKVGFYYLFLQYETVTVQEVP